MPRKIEVSHKTIFFTLGVLGLAWLVIQIWDIILLIFVSIILVSALHSPVNRLAKKRIPRPLAILFFYFLIVTAFLGVTALLVPALIEQTKTLFASIPFLVEGLNKLFLDQLPANEFLKSVGGLNLGESIFRYTWSFFGNIVTIVTLFVFTFYLLLRWENLGKFLSAGLGNEEKYTNLLHQIESGLGNWVRGEILLMAIIGVMSYIGLRLLGVPYALSLSLFAGLLEIIPIIGPIVGAIPAVIVTLAISPILALATVALYFIIQQLENHLIVPKVMQRAVGLDPLATILAIMVGMKLMGVLGALLSVPSVILGKIILLELYRGRKAQVAKEILDAKKI